LTYLAASPVEFGIEIVKAVDLRCLLFGIVDASPLAYAVAGEMFVGRIHEEEVAKVGPSQRIAVHLVGKQLVLLLDLALDF
jgi:hypothetical protein